MQVFTAPEVFPHEGPSLFLAGGITGCINWQSEMLRLLVDRGYSDIVLNPRRENFPMDNPKAAEEQILWEYAALHSASRILFWFPCETLCPITLYELGAHCHRYHDKVPILIGVHPEFQRKQDVEIQTRLCRPEIKIVYSLEDLANQVVKDRR